VDACREIYTIETDFDQAKLAPVNATLVLLLRLARAAQNGSYLIQEEKKEWRLASTGNAIQEYAAPQAGQSAAALEEIWFGRMR
jgi:hypothetical protein